MEDSIVTTERNDNIVGKARKISDWEKKGESEKAFFFIEHKDKRSRNEELRS